MPVEGSQIDRAARPAAGTEHLKPGSSGEQRSPDRGRPQHIATSRQAPIPSVDDGLGLLARGAIRPELGDAGLDVWPSGPNSHRASIGGQASEVDPPVPSRSRRTFVAGDCYGRWQRSAGFMRDFPSPAFLWGAGLLALLILALGPALDGASLKEAATVPALMAIWAGVVMLIDRWVVGPR